MNEMTTNIRDILTEMGYTKEEMEEIMREEP